MIRPYLTLTSVSALQELCQLLTNLGRAVRPEKVAGALPRSQPRARDAPRERLRVARRHDGVAISAGHEGGARQLGQLLRAVVAAHGGQLALHPSGSAARLQEGRLELGSTRHDGAGSAARRVGLAARRVGSFPVQSALRPAQRAARQPPRPASMPAACSA
eukprot:scaffold6389_cov75-Phaeocystis_antarctica.AAC.9